MDAAVGQLLDAVEAPDTVHARLGDLETAVQ
jgi:hypothetical protein